MRKLTVGVFVCAATAGASAVTSGRAQPAPAFEVASIKENKSGPGAPMRIGFTPGGRFQANNVPARDLIAVAYGTPQPLPPFQMVRALRPSASSWQFTTKRARCRSTSSSSIERTASSGHSFIREQLGLKLDSSRGPVEVVVIDQIERPTPD